jgi:hypothetical protein
MDVAVLILNRGAFIAATGVVHSFEPVAMHAENTNAQAVASAINKSVGTIDCHGSRHLGTSAQAIASCLRRACARDENKKLQLAK